MLPGLIINAVVATLILHVKFNITFGANNQ